MDKLKILLTRIAHSKTMWLALAVEILGFLQASQFLLSRFLTSRELGIFLIAVGIAIRILRFVTTQPLADK
jgi:hypothetical protein